MKLRHSARTDVGKTRDHNEDDFGVGEGAGVEQYGELLVVCDGMGGHAAGEVASHLGVETILSSYYGDPSEDRTEVLQKAFERANEHIHAEGRGTMGTTGVAALLYQGMLHIANVGDSRAYLIRDGAIRQISRDHSLVGEQVAAGVITAEQARSLYYRNVITRALGYQSEVVVDLFHYPLQAGDTIVLSSDGLHGLVTDDEICQTALTLPLTDAVDRLIDLANERGGTDNITAIIAHVDDLDLPAAHAAERTAADQPTVELPVTVVPDQSLEEETPAPAVGAAMPGEPAISPAATLRPRVAYAPPAPRRLTWRGALLAFVLFAALSAVTLFVAYPSVLAPGISAPPPTAPPTSVPLVTASNIPAATATASRTATQTATLTPQATASPTATATVGETRTPIPITPITRTPAPVTASPRATTGP